MKIISMDEYAAQQKQKSTPVRVQYATISPAYTSGKPKLIFDGETIESIITYQKASNYTPTAGDPVMVIDGVVAFKIDR